MHNMGLLNKWISRTFGRISPRNPAIYPVGGMNKLYENPTDQKATLNKSKEKELSLSDLKSVFYVCLIGIGLSFVLLLVELLKFHCLN